MGCFDFNFLSFSIVCVKPIDSGFSGNIIILSFLFTLGGHKEVAVIVTGPISINPKPRLEKA